MSELFTYLKVSCETAVMHNNDKYSKLIMIKYNHTVMTKIEPNSWTFTQPQKALSLHFLNKERCILYIIVLMCLNC